MASLKSGRASRLAKAGVPFLLFLLLPLGLLTFRPEIAAQSGDQQIAQLIHRAQSALDAGDFSLAAQAFEHGLELSPENPEVNRGLVLSYLQAGRLADAQRAAQIAVARWPRDVELQHWLGLVYFKLGQHENALQALRRAESLDSNRYDIHFDTALVLLSDNRYPAAADELEKAVKLEPNAALPHLLLGRADQNTTRSC